MKQAYRKKYDNLFAIDTRLTQSGFFIKKRDFKENPLISINGNGFGL